MQRLPIPCPWCQLEVEVAPGSAEVACPQCGSAVDVQAQFCYLRACDAFADAGAARPAGRRKKARAETPETIACYLQAYSSFQEALHGALSGEQLRFALETLADIAQAFAGRLMVSGEEAAYWQKRAVAANTQRELGELQARLAQRSGGVIGCVRRSHAALRRQQLTRAGKRLQRQISSLEASVLVADREPSPGTH